MPHAFSNSSTSFAPIFDAMLESVEGKSESDVAMPERIVAPLVRFAGALSSLGILAALAMTAYMVVMRYAFNRPPIWADELLSYLLVALIMAGMTEAYRCRSHIAIDLLTANLTGRVARLKNAWGDLCVLIVALLLAHSAWSSLIFAREFGFYSIGPLEAPMWIPMVPVFAGFCLMVLLAAARLLGLLWPGARE